MPLRSLEVQIGNLLLGGLNPVRIQSMANTHTLDTKASVEQAIRIIKAGGQLVRFTTQGIREAENLVQIKKELNKKGYAVPLVADVHFNPSVAEVAARLVEKVRINPGNYADKKKFQQVEFTEGEYAGELERIHAKLLPLISICKEYGTVIRIGVNHGSLSDRIMSRYGDTPGGMVESALEFLSIFTAEGFHRLVVSMKASNTRVMIQATRMLYYRMQAAGTIYPLHLGVTEAGEGEDGKIKSAAGIGALLAEGIGDTIRVSLTGDSELEIPVARKLADMYPLSRNASTPARLFRMSTVDPTSYDRRPARQVSFLGGSRSPAVMTDADPATPYNGPLKPQPEFIYLTDPAVTAWDQAESIPVCNWPGPFNDTGRQRNILPLLPASVYKEELAAKPDLRLVLAEASGLDDTLIRQLENDPSAALVLQSFGKNAVYELRKAFETLGQASCKVPVIINLNFAEEELESLQVKAAAAYGALFLDGLGDGIWLRNAGSIPQEQVYSIAKGILQACRMRTFKTEYISCPSCGRTLFDISRVLQEIRERTTHLVHLKIAVMGCIVNGPGEMADADYGYVGAGPGKITLYKGKEVVKKNIPSVQAVDELVSLITANGDWLDK